jgi:hypothetical protein
MFYLSEYIDLHKDEYIDRLNALGCGKHAWRLWTDFFLHAIAAQAQQNVSTAEAILSLYDRLKDTFIAVTHSRYAVPLLDAVFELQYFQAGQLTWKGEPPSTPTLMSMLQALEKGGIIKVYRSSSGRRSSIWWLPELIQLIEKRPLAV